VAQIALRQSNGGSFIGQREASGRAFPGRAHMTRGPGRFIPPMAAQTTSELPEGPEWVYEVKFDGYRALLMKAGDRIQIRSRNDKDLTTAYPAIVEGARRLSAPSLTLDGEIVALDASSRPSFQALQHRAAHPHHIIVYYAFDLLYLAGEDLTGLPLATRRARLETLVKGPIILRSELLAGRVSDIVTAVRSLGLEGVIAKRQDSRYVPGERTSAWRKLKLDRQQEFAIGGYRPGTHGVDALLVGYYEGRELRFAGKVRAGFTPHLRRQVFAELQRLHVDKCPFVDLPNSKASHWGGGVTAEQMAEMQWVTPKLVAQVRFVEWTAEGHLRHAAFLGLRVDKRAKDVRREV
jgi:DNA ligase D-like protein (predicted ligase)